MPITYNQTGVTYDSAAYSYDGYDAPLANMPAVGVFIAWTDTPYTVSPAWTEISQYVRQISIRRGRQDDLQQFPPGTASLVLDNRERLFDPFNTSGANYANLKPRKQIKIVANWAGVEYPLYRGFVAGWPVEYTDAGLDSTVTIDCFDVLGLLANETLPADWPEYYVSSLSPTHYWKCNDSRGTQQILDRPGTGQPNLTASTGSAGLFFSEAPPMAEGLVGNSMYVPSYNATSATNNDQPNYTMSFWFLNPSQQTGSLAYIDTRYNGTNILFEWTGQANPTLKVANASNSRTYTLTGLQRQLPTHIVVAVTANSGGTPTAAIYVDGLAVSPSSTTNIAGSFPEQRILIVGAQVQEIATFNGLLTVEQVQNIYNYSTARVTENTTARMNRLLATTSFPTGLRSFTSSPQATVSQLDSKYQPLPGMRIVAESESGELFVDEEGIVNFLPRNYWASEARSNTSQMTFTDTGTGIKYDANEIRIDLNADQIRNDVNIEFTGNGSVDARDATSVSTYGAAQETIKTFLDSPTSAQTLADLRLSLYKNPKLRLEPFLSKGQQNPSYNWPRLLGLELLDRVTFKRTPSVGSAVQRDLLVQSIEHRITPGEWQTVVNGSTRYTGWFIIGVSLIGSSEDVLL